MSIAYKLPIIPLILLLQLNAYHHLPLINPPTPNWRVLVRLDPASLDDISSDVLLTGWHTCSIKKTTNNCRRQFGAEPLKIPPNGNPLGVSIADECVCMCPLAKPVFVYGSDGSGKCVYRLEDCQKPVVFKNTGKESDIAQIPLVSSPKQRSSDAVLPPKWVALWKESSIKVRPNTGVRCETTKLSYLGGTSMDWRDGEVDWIRFGWADNTAQVFWNLSKTSDPEAVSKALASSILKLNIKCYKGSHSHEHCMAYRLSGQILGDSAVVDSESITSKPARPITPLNNQHHQQANGQQGRLETILIILLAILLFLSIFGSIVLWNVCWRLKKSELISTLQMQFLYHIKQEKEKASTDAQQRYLAKSAPNSGSARMNAGQPAPPNGYAPNSSGGVYGEDLEDASAVAEEEQYGAGSCQPFGGQESARRQQEYGDASQNQLCGGGPPAKRKLYFSAEFFEPHLMSNPPQMAEQFLYDLRKMIAITKQRLLLRSRHIPRLSVIMEEDAEASQNQVAIANTHHQNYAYYSTEEDEEGMDGEFEDLEGHQVDLTTAPRLPRSPVPIGDCEGSPKSVKSDPEGSGDSGVVSSESNSDCSSSSQSPPNTPPTLAGANSSSNSGGVKRVRQLVKGFESPPPIKTLLTVPSASTANRRAQSSSTTARPPNSCFQTTPTPPSSRIPVSKSPRLAPKSLSLAQPLSINANLGGGGSPMANTNTLIGIIQQHNQSNGPPLPPRNTPPPPPPTQPPPPIPSSTIGEHANAMLMVAAANQQQKSRLAAQKRAAGGGTYAVFPSDSLKKSLPRRSKKAIAEARANFLNNTSSPTQPHRTIANKTKGLIETKM